MTGTRLSVLGLLAGIAVLLSPAFAQATDAGVAITPVQPSEPGLSSAAEVLTPALVAQVQSVSDVPVVTPQEIETLTRRAQQQLQLGCFDDAACLAQLAQTLKGERVLFSDVGRVGDTWVLNLRLVAPGDAQVLSRQQVTGGSLQALQEGLSGGVRALFAELGGGGVLHVDLSALGRQPTIAVMEIGAYDVDSGLADALGSALAVELSQLSGLKVISSKDVAAMLDLEARKQAIGCDDIACMAEIGGALGVRHLATGSISRIADRYVVNLRIIDARAGQVIGLESERYAGPPDDLLVGMRFLVRRLFSAPYKGEGRFNLRVLTEEALVNLDGVELGPAPPQPQEWTLPAGRHALSVLEADHHPLRRDFYVEPARVTRLDVRLKEVEVPWYRTWWFWTGVGVVAAAGAASAAVIATQEDAGDGRVTWTAPELP